VSLVKALLGIPVTLGTQELRVIPVVAVVAVVAVVFA
jgi:hypothetical protein